MCDLKFDGDLAWSNNSRPIARKAHRCVVCHNRIEFGERYYRASYKREGEVGTDACCQWCEKDLDEFGDAHDGHPFPSSFWDFLTNCIVDERESRWRAMLLGIIERTPQRYRTEAHAQWLEPEDES